MTICFKVLFELTHFTSAWCYRYLKRIRGSLSIVSKGKMLRFAFRPLAKLKPLASHSNRSTRNLNGKVLTPTYPGDLQKRTKRGGGKRLFQETSIILFVKLKS